MGENCLVLGGNGFLGSHLSESLVSAGFEVTVFDIFPQGQSNLEAIIDKIKVIEGDFCDNKKVANALDDMDYVFHYISTTNPITAKDDPIYDAKTNIISSINLFQNILHSNVKKIIFPSSGGTIYGNIDVGLINEDHPLKPINPYGISKLTIEKYLQYYHQIHGLDYLILRYSNPFGERQNPYGKQGVIPIFLNKILRGEQIVAYGDGSMIRDYIYISDAIEATLAVLEKTSKEKIFNIGRGVGTSLNELIDIISEIVDMDVMPRYTGESKGYVTRFVLDNSKIKKYTGWEPTTTLREGIAKTWEWVKNY
ncbi:NAD-dependent epimerase/dehydratase family protein [Candidatus Altiarchaeota archaeon]